MEEFRVDTHTHLLVDKTEHEPDWCEIQKTLDLAASSGLSAICVTEHIEAVGYGKLIEQLFVKNHLKGIDVGGGYRLSNGITIFPGAEIQLVNGSNIGVHAPVEVLLRLDRRAGWYSLESLREDLDNFGERYALVAHHIFWPNKTYPDHDLLAGLVHAIEKPAKDFRNGGAYQQLASKYVLPTTGGSDAHNFIQVGASYTKITTDAGQLNHSSFIDSLLNKECQAVDSVLIDRLIVMAKVYRQQQLSQLRK